jgi:hypothetical protein
VELLHRLHVAGVGHDDGVLAQLFKQIWHDPSSGRGSRLVFHGTVYLLLFKMR